MGYTPIARPTGTPEPEEDWWTPFLSTLGAVGGAALGFIPGLSPVAATILSGVGGAVGQAGGTAAGRTIAGEDTQVSPFGQVVSGLGSVAGGAVTTGAGMYAKQLADATKSAGNAAAGGMLKEMMMEQAGAVPESLRVPEGYAGTREQHWENIVEAQPWLKVQAENDAWLRENPFPGFDDWMGQRDFDTTSELVRAEQLPQYAAAKQIYASKSPYGKLKEMGYGKAPTPYMEGREGFTRPVPLVERAQVPYEQTSIGEGFDPDSLKFPEGEPYVKKHKYDWTLRGLDVIGDSDFWDTEHYEAAKRALQGDSSRHGFDPEAIQELRGAINKYESSRGVSTAQPAQAGGRRGQEPTTLKPPPRRGIQDTIMHHGLQVPSQGRGIQMPPSKLGVQPQVPPAGYEETQYLPPGAEGLMTAMRQRDEERRPQLSPMYIDPYGRFV
jgi:hypothetical protein